MEILDVLLDLVTNGRYSLATDAEVERTRAALEQKIRTVGASNQDLLTVIAVLVEQNRDLSARVGALVKLLVDRGLIASDEYALQVKVAKAAQPPIPSIVPRKPVKSSPTPPPPPPNGIKPTKPLGKLIDPKKLGRSAKS